MANEEQFQTDVGSFVRGPRGYTGATPNIDMEVATGEPGTNVQIEKSGTPENPAFRLTVPRGDTGATPNISMEAATGEPGTDVQIEKSGTPENPAFRLTVPRGNPGDGVRYDEVQTLTDEQKAQAQSNMGAASAESVSALKDDISDAWTSGKTYAVGDYCISGNRLYKCKTAHTAGSAFNADYWDATIITVELSEQTKYSDIINFDKNFIAPGAFTINRKGNILSSIGVTTLPFNWDNYPTVVKRNGILNGIDNLIIYDLTDSRFLTVNKDGANFKITCYGNHTLMFWGVFSG